MTSSWGAKRHRRGNSTQWETRDGGRFGTGRTGARMSDLLSLFEAQKPAPISSRTKKLLSLFSSPNPPPPARTALNAHQEVSCAKTPRENLVYFCQRNLEAFW